MVSNRRLVNNEGADFYPTPAWGTKALIKYETFSGTILEPCCGDGSMSEVLKQTGCEVFSSDLYDRGYGEVKDFFDVKENFNNIITNPPYNIAEDILEHALSLATHKVAILVRTAFLESQKRYHRFYAENPPSKVYVFSERLSMYPAGSPVKGGGTTSYSWIIWDNSVEKKNTELLFIEPGLKKIG